MDVYHGISAGKLEEILRNINKIQVVLIGDLCLDVYWKADMTRSELSRETPHFPLPVVEERMSPGGGGNTAANIAALQPKNMKVLGVVGRDWRGDLLIRKLQEAGLDTADITVSNTAVTNAYCKPIRKGISELEVEDPRLDFCNYIKLQREDEERLLYALKQNAAKADLLCVCDQLLLGCITPTIREEILRLAKSGIKVVVDSRDRIGFYEEVILKPNLLEGMKALYGAYDSERESLESCAETAKNLALRTKSKICMTLGALGCVYSDGTATVHVPSHKVETPVDICGAGDTHMSAFSCALAAGAEPWEAASLANTAAEITIRKIGLTGAAAPDDIRARHAQLFPWR